MKIGSILQGHPDHTKVPGVEISSGSLGMGLSIANGIALAGKMDNAKHRVFVLIGDGECDEGMIWEAAMTASHYKLDNVFAFLDKNGLQIDGSTNEIMKLDSLKEKWKAFGWHVIEIDGHNISEIITAIEEGMKIKDKPKMIIAKTIKGKGVSFMENSLHFHGKAPNKEEYEIALKELT